MSHGYTVSLLVANKKADNSSIGVVLGKECISRNIPVALVSTKLKVSRQTVYSWFSGYHKPVGKHVVEIKKFLTEVRENRYGARVVL
jgi:hypothetical protein